MRTRIHGLTGPALPLALALWLATSGWASATAGATTIGHTCDHDAAASHALRSLAVNTAMRSWVRQTVPRRGSDRVRLVHLWNALTNAQHLGLREVVRPTGTAEEAFLHRQANCVAFALLFVSLARELDVPAYFMLFSRIESYENRADLRVGNAHLAAAYGPPERPVIFDFGGLTTPAGAHPQVLSDVTAAAIFHSNRGAEHLLAGQASQAIEQLRTAVCLDPRLTIGWTNLGVALSRQGQRLQAEAAYRRALSIDPESLPAWKNLALLLTRRIGEHTPPEP